MKCRKKMSSVQVYVVSLPKAGVRSEGVLRLPASLISDPHVRAEPHLSRDKIT